MKNFLTLAAIAALSAHQVQAVCDTSATADECSDWTDLNTAVTNYSGDYAWKFYDVTTADDYNLKVFRFTGDSTNNQVTDQWTKGAVLFLAPARQDCSWWLADVQDTNSDSIPKQLFDLGYDVWLGCKRGTEFSLTNNTLDSVTDAEQYWDFNTDTIGTNDIPAMVGLIQSTNKGGSTGSDCIKVQIIAQCLGSSEALTTLSLLPSASGNWISRLINLAPCAVRDEPSSCTKKHHSKHRMLSEVDPDVPSEPPRILDEAVQADFADFERGLSAADRKLEHFEEKEEGRELGHWYCDFWCRTKKHCKWYPNDCYNFCYWYPYYCDEFCSRFPTFCQPKCVAKYYTYLSVLEENGIYSMFGPNWSTQVDTICMKFGSWSETCTDLQATVDQGIPEMSVQQAEHLWQQSYTREFDQFSSTFASDGWTADTPNIPIESIGVDVLNGYVKDDAICDETFNGNLLDAIPTQDVRTLFVGDGVDNFNIGVQNGNASVVNYIVSSLAAGDQVAVDDCEADPFSWTEEVDD